MEANDNNGGTPGFGEETQKSSFKLLGQISKPGKTESLAVLVGFVSDKAKEHGFSEQRVKEVEAAITRILTATINNAYQTATGDVEITCKVDPWDNLIMLIADTGKPYNILLADNPFDEDQAESEERAAAKLVKKLIDNIEFKIMDTRNLLTLTTSGKPRGISF